MHVECGNFTHRLSWVLCLLCEALKNTPFYLQNNTSQTKHSICAPRFRSRQPVRGWVPTKDRSPEHPVSPQRMLVWNQVTSQAGHGLTVRTSWAASLTGASSRPGKLHKANFLKTVVSSVLGQLFSAQSYRKSLLSCLLHKNSYPQPPCHLESRETVDKMCKGKWEKKELRLQNKLHQLETAQPQRAISGSETQYATRINLEEPNSIQIHQSIK